MKTAIEITLLKDHPLKIILNLQNCIILLIMRVCGLLNQCRTADQTMSLSSILVIVMSKYEIKDKEHDSLSEFMPVIK